MAATSVKFVKLGVYLVFVGGVGALCIKGADFAGETAMALALPYFAAPATRPVTLVERRQQALETVVAARAEPEPLIPPAPSIPLIKLASAMDLAERIDLGIARQSARRAKPKLRASPVRVAAADVFGRSFGVMIRVSR